jgi:hypothetical protein
MWRLLCYPYSAPLIPLLRRYTWLSSDFMHHTGKIRKQQDRGERRTISWWRSSGRGEGGWKIIVPSAPWDVLGSLCNILLVMETFCVSGSIEYGSVMIHCREDPNYCNHTYVQCLSLPQCFRLMSAPPLAKSSWWDKTLFCKPTRLYRDHLHVDLSVTVSWEVLCSINAKIIPELNLHTVLLTFLIWI